MGDYLELNIFMTQNNMLPAYTKVNQAKLIFIFTSRLSPVLSSSSSDTSAGQRFQLHNCSMMYLVNIVTHVQMS